MRVRILGTSDLHMNAVSFDYYSDKAEPTIGLTRTTSLIRAAREEAISDNALVLCFDNGDSLQGTPVGEWSTAHLDEGHALMQAFDHLGYDAIGLGNHDFSFGLETLERIIDLAPCPVLSSNAHRWNGTAPWQGEQILTRQVQLGTERVELKIGVISVLPPQTVKWEAHRLKGALWIDDILSCARWKTRRLKALDCDLIIALAHTGLGTERPQANLENAAIPLAAINGIDAVIAGHTHLTLPGAAYEGLAHVDARTGHVHGTPMVMPGAAGSHLGLIDLSLSYTDGWQVQHSRAELRAIAPGPDQPPVPEDPAVLRLFDRAHSETRKHTRKPVGHTSKHLHSYFSFCAQDHGLALVAAAQAAALRPYLMGTEYADLPVLSAVSPSKFGGRAGPRFFTDVPAGEIRHRHVADLSVFPNEMLAIIVSGAQIHAWLEMSAGVLNQQHPDTLSTLLHHDRAGHNFDVLHGLTYQIDLNKPARFDAEGAVTEPSSYRISDIRHEGQPIEETQLFMVAVNNYRANGGGHFPFVEEAVRFPLPILPIQRIIQDYLSGAFAADPLAQAPRPFRLTAPKGAKAILNTGLAARDHLADIAEFQPEILGQNPDGFLQISLTL